MNPPLSAYLYADENEVVEELIKSLPWDKERARAVQNKAEGLVTKIRSRKGKGGQLEAFLQQYSLDTEEGLALMTLAEALLRIPDKDTANALIRDKIEAANWFADGGGSSDWKVKAAGIGLSLTRKTLDSVLSKVGEPVIREAMIKAMGMMGQEFVLGRDMDEALKRSKDFIKNGYRMSYDVLGEGARTQEDADRYYASYTEAIKRIGEHKTKEGQKRPGMSVKLSALHPRYEYAQKELCVPVLTEKLAELAKISAALDITLTVDAEEVDRLEMSLQIIEGVLREKSLGDWEGFGLAVQAYQKRARPLVEYMAAMAQNHKRRLQMRLVKGAYWDSEIKWAQMAGMPDYPLFTRKANTDLSYLACAATMFKNKDNIFPMFGTHNAHTVTAIMEMGQEHNTGYEFQKLYGMGDSMYDALLEGRKDTNITIYAPVGPHEDLLPYLVRRLLENGANSSFLNKLLDKEAPAASLVIDPVETVKGFASIRHPQIPLPADIYAGEEPRGRRNSKGIDLTDEAAVVPLLKKLRSFKNPYEAGPLVDGKVHKDSVPQEIKNPADESDNMGMVWPANKALVDKAFDVAQAAFDKWVEADANERAGCLERFADLMEENIEELMAICIREAGKTIPDAIGEIREAVDFCRYYANRGRADFAAEGIKLPGPTGESNAISLHGRGVFVCISPWNFPLAIFTGQVVAALMAGNTVIAKPAEQTPIIAMRAVQLMHKAGFPAGAINLLPGAGDVGAMLTAHEKVAGMAFTGSTEVAWEINKTLAAKKGPIVPLIAETGGQNAMIVDSSALLEQVIDDVLLSAFGSAGQRCSALRILCLQDNIADKAIKMLKGAMTELHVGDPSLLSSDIGPVIDEEARSILVRHRKNLEGFGKLVFEVPFQTALSARGHFFAPCAFELDGLKGLTREVFGPVLHIVRYKPDEVDELIDDLNAMGYGLTFGVHSRIESFQKRVAARIKAGNVYINRSMIGAVVGVQPFGGRGLSGTGPKAGGPHYLARFATEKVISIDTTAAGGNASLVSIEE
jgi:RHH-type transcriptional regulator, proline utilization regulon repressor / proline dehydrogenase / delta 1-pyrroline-5-carboxylate dehydrogenase